MMNYPVVICKAISPAGIYTKEILRALGYNLEQIAKMGKTIFFD
jgi:hypothetical protein